MQDFDGCFEVEALAGSVVDSGDGPLDLLVCDLVEWHRFREVLAEQAVGVFAQPALPAVVGSREVGVAAGGPGDQRVVRELAPVVVGDGVEDVPEPLGDAARDAGRLGLGLARDAARGQCPRLAFRQRHESPAVDTADDGVALPMADPGALLHVVRALRDVHPAWDPAPEFVLAVAPPPLLRGVPEAGVRVAPLALVAPHELMDGLVRHPGAALQTHAAGDLFGTPVQPQLPDHMRLHILRQPNASPTGGMPPVGEALRLLRAVPPRPVFLFSSRETVEGARPSDLAISDRDSPSFRRVLM